MRRFLKQALCLCVFFVLPLALLAEDFMAEGNALYDKGKTTSYESYKASGDMFVKALEATPGNYSDADGAV